MFMNMLDTLFTTFESYVNIDNMYLLGVLWDARGFKMCKTFNVV